MDWDELPPENDEGPTCQLPDVVNNENASLRCHDALRKHTLLSSKDVSSTSGVSARSTATG